MPFQPQTMHIPCSNMHDGFLRCSFQAANLLFSSNSTEAAAYDFQYVGRGLGALDVAYLIIW
eukprot:1156977-Pelagomonas_calceolata.AAC.5